VNTDLFPHVNGKPNLTAQGRFSLAYRAPEDLHLTLLFESVSMEFCEAYVFGREWCRDATAMGWRFRCLPAVDIGGMVQ